MLLFTFNIPFPRQSVLEMLKVVMEIWRGGGLAQIDAWRSESIKGRLSAAQRMPGLRSIHYSCIYL
jgi:hypothetical protein